MSEMKVWTHTKFSGYWPVGTAAVVVAETADDAAEILAEALTDNGLAQDINPSDFSEFQVKPGSWAILCDGDY